MQIVLYVIPSVVEGSLNTPKAMKQRSCFYSFHPAIDIYPHRVYNVPGKHIPSMGILKERMPMPSVKEVQCACDRKKTRDEAERHDLMNRLKRIEGQVRGLQRMLEEDAYCPEILTQASAVNSALNSFCRVLLTSHLRTCVSEDIRAGREDTVDELMLVLQKLMK